jgi:hypothetical protein
LFNESALAIKTYRQRHSEGAVMTEAISRRSRIELISRNVKGTFSSKKEKECKHCRQIKDIACFPITSTKGSHKWYGAFCPECLELLTKRVCACGCGEVLPKTTARDRLYRIGHNPEATRVRPTTQREYLNDWYSRNPEKKLTYYLKYHYGITLEDYRTLEKVQNNRCAICHRASPGGRYRYWCVDHDHVTGTVRGLLCLRCNAGIAALGDTAEGVKRAVTYFEPPLLDGISMGLLL